MIWLRLAVPLAIGFMFGHARKNVMHGPRVIRVATNLIMVALLLCVLLFECTSWLPQPLKSKAILVCLALAAGSWLATVEFRCLWREEEPP